MFITVITSKSIPFPGTAHTIRYAACILVSSFFGNSRKMREFAVCFGDSIERYKQTKPEMFVTLQRPVANSNTLARMSVV